MLCKGCDKCYIEHIKRLDLKNIKKNLKNQEVEKFPLAEYFLKYNYTVKTIKLIKDANNYEKLNKRAAIAVFKNKNK